MMSRNNRQRLLLASGVALLTMGCQTMGSNSDQPARIVGADAASRAALHKAVSTAFGTDVTLAPDALTDSSILVIERNPRPTLDRPNPQGRNMEQPFQLRLYKNGDDCILVDERDQTRYVLADTSCIAE